MVENARIVGEQRRLETNMYVPPVDKTYMYAHSELETYPMTHYKGN